MITRYFHGGKPGRQRGAFLLPPSVTGGRSMADYGLYDETAPCRRDRVYVTISIKAALMYAAGQRNGVIYEVEPVGQIERDPDCTEEEFSFQCEKAKVIRIIKPAKQAINIARMALLEE